MLALPPVWCSQMRFATRHTDPPLRKTACCTIAQSIGRDEATVGIRASGAAAVVMEGTRQSSASAAVVTAAMGLQWSYCKTIQSSKRTPIINGRAHLYSGGHASMYNASSSSALDAALDVAQDAVLDATLYAVLDVALYAVLYAVLDVALGTA